MSEDRSAPPGTLQGAYGPKSPAEARAFYEGWAADYERDTLGQGFPLPFLAAGFLARRLEPSAGPLLDAACGTGLVGFALSTLGHGPITGVDLSGEMLAVARARGHYATLREGDLSQALPFADDAFAGTACVGAFGPGHAPPSCLAELIRVTRPGGPLAFNVRPDTYESQGFAAEIERLTADGAWRPLDRSDPFPVYLLNDLDLSATIFVFQVT